MEIKPFERMSVILSEEEKKALSSTCALFHKLHRLLIDKKLPYFKCDDIHRFNSIALYDLACTLGTVCDAESLTIGQ